MTDSVGGNSDEWDAFVADHPLATYLQLSGWARVKAANGWTSRLVEVERSGKGASAVPHGPPVGRRIGARVLLRRPRGVPWAFAYAPRGPLASDWAESSLATWSGAAHSAFAQHNSPTDVGRVAHVRIDPEIELGGPLDRDGSTRASLERLGWRPAPEVQPSVTRIIDLTGDEAGLWSDLRKKWRQYVNRARTLGVTVADIDADADSSAFPTFHRIMAETARRTGTPIRTEAAYRDIWDALRPSGGARLLFACDRHGLPEAALLLVRCGTRVVEPYGGMTAAGADSRANYLLKWEAIRSSREQGATSYDLWGLVHPGIRQFKEGFGGREVRLIGAWDLPIGPVGATVYRLAERLRRPVAGIGR